MTSDADVCGKLDVPGRQNAWVFAGWVQLFSAIYFRFTVVNITNPKVAFGVIIWQALLEIALRLTVRQRDELLGSLKQCVCKRKTRERRRTKVVSLTKTLKLSSLQLQLSSSEHEERNEAKNAFYSLLIISDMMAEYTGIVLSSLTVVVYRNRRLFVPLPIYASQALNEPFETTSVLVYLGLQIFGELLVDSVCLYHEEKKSSVNSGKVWKGLYKRSFFLMYIFATGYGYCCAFAIVYGSDSFSKCMGKNMCCCVNNGLVEGGVFDAYCALLQEHKNVSWSPPPSFCSP